ncbi:hypothetical protein Leryth_026543 [Lithospermum erythrorhizon]|nr:hypothetical protein Leryth_026543 [Lithospermum erythrorhizon]
MRPMFGGDVCRKLLEILYSRGPLERIGIIWILSRRLSIFTKSLLIRLERGAFVQGRNIVDNIWRAFKGVRGCTGYSLDGSLGLHHEETYFISFNGEPLAILKAKRVETKVTRCRLQNVRGYLRFHPKCRGARITSRCG